jgi:hypothetical protein
VQTLFWGLPLRIQYYVAAEQSHTDLDSVRECAPFSKVAACIEKKAARYDTGRSGAEKDISRRLGTDDQTAKVRCDNSSRWPPLDCMVGG